MEMKSFEDELNVMTKPEISELKHQELMSKAVLSVKDKSVVSSWWLAIPLYVIGALLLKSFYTKHSLLSNIREMKENQPNLSLFIFLIVPVVFAVVNLFEIRKMNLFSGKLKGFSFLRIVWFNFLMIALSVFILFIYLL
ncbi:MAG TPA: hypothetical protein VFT78_01870 [Hanamia sp.]|nr:hypothetical protein [Hanamia sp.]